MSASPAGSPPTLTAVAATAFAGGLAGALAYNAYTKRVQDERSSSNSSRGRAYAPEAPRQDWFFAAAEEADEDFVAGFRASEVFSDTDVSTAVLNHMTRVYAALGATVLAATLGSALQIRSGGALPSGVASLGALGAGLSLIYTKPALWKLLVFGALQGASLGELVKLGMAVNPGIVPAALTATTLTFGSFAAVSTLVSKKTTLWLGGILSSALSVLSAASLVGLLVPNSRVLFNTQLYGGLAVFCGWVVVDSSAIVERASRGHRDYVTDAMLLFTDATAIFTRLVILMLKQQAKQQRRRDEEEESESRRQRKRR